MKPFVLKYKNHIMVLLGVATLVLLLLSKKSPPVPKVVSLAPIDASWDVDLRATPSYQVNTSLSLSDLVLTSTPDFKFELSEPTPKTFIATHSLAFQPATTYTLTLSWQGHPILTHSFTTLKSQEDPLLIQNMKDELARDYPLAQLLPYTTALYHVVYSSPMTLEITLKNSNLSSGEAINDIKSWVSKNGGDVEAHKYTTRNAIP